jgi:hypothetical protein
LLGVLSVHWIVTFSAVYTLALHSCSMMFNLLVRSSGMSRAIYLALCAAC